MSTICEMHKNRSLYYGVCYACDIEERREGWQVRCIQAEAVCRYLRGEVERLEVKLALMQIQRDARPKIPIVINSGCKHHNIWVDVYDTKKSYRCPDCGLEYDEVTHE